MEFVGEALLLLGVDFVHRKEERLAGADAAGARVRCRETAISVRPSTTMMMASASSSATLAWRKISAGMNLFFGNNAAGIDDAQAAPAPFGLAVEPVAGDAGFVADDGAPRSHQPVEERGFADVGTAHDGERGNAALRPATSLKLAEP